MVGANFQSDGERIGKSTERREREDERARENERVDEKILLSLTACMCE